MKIAILGFGLEGRSLLKFLCQSGFYRNAEITVCDRNSKLSTPVFIGGRKTKKLSISDTPKSAGIYFRIGPDYLKNLNQFNLIFRSPGVPYNLPEIQKAVKIGIEISSVTKLFFKEAKKLGCKIIGVSGTKGKGTTATLIYRMLKASGKNVFLAGNIGKPATDLLPMLLSADSAKRKETIVVLELSSFQLEDSIIVPEISAIVDVFPDHLDAHKNLKEYLNAEANIAKRQKKGDKIFYFKDNKYSRQIALKSLGEKIPLEVEKFALFNQKDLKIPGYHNFKNAAMAAVVCLFLDCPPKIVLRTAKFFKGNEHRLEFVRNIKGIKFYNDSASTVPQTTAAAVSAFKEPKILIVGGRDKNLDYAFLADSLKNSNTDLSILFGENKPKIKEELLKVSQALNKKHRKKIVQFPKIKTARDLAKAVELAYQSAKKLKNQNDCREIIVLFSPASASFDMFLNYTERGKQFKKIVKNL